MTWLLWCTGIGLVLGFLFFTFVATLTSPGGHEQTVAEALRDTQGRVVLVGLVLACFLASAAVYWLWQLVAGFFR